MHRMTLGLVCVCLGSAFAATEVPVPDAKDPVAWSLNPDGGTRLEWAADRELRHSGEQALRIRYRDAAPHWGNLQHAVTVPADATAFSFWLYVRQAAPGAAMHVWFFEPDGDGWVQRVTVGGVGLDALKPGWQRVEMPIGGFRHDPRGDGKRGLAGANRILMGCNYGDLDVTLDDLAFVVKSVTKGVPPPRTEPWQVAQGTAGRAAVLCDPDFPPAGAGSDPQRLAGWLREAGWGVTPVRAADLGDAERLNRKNFDLLVLANGAAFPAAAAAPFKAFLKAGGKWINLGGYALDQPTTFDGARWGADECVLTVRDMDAGRGAPLCLNTRVGKPGDTLGLQPDQIGAFDPSFQLQHAQFATAAPGQFVVPADARLDVPLEGFAAVAMTGSNSPVFPVVHGRWIPLLTARDRYGRECGPAAAMVLNFDGPYKGSAWAFSGVTNVDVLADDGARDSIVRIADFLRLAVFLRQVETDLACYRDGEPVQLRVCVANFGPAPDHVRVRLCVRTGMPEAGGREAYAVEGEADVAAGSEQPLEWEWKPGPFESDFFTVTATLQRRAAAGAEFADWDRMETGFVVWREAVLRGGFPIRFKDNYFRDAQDKPRFLTGSNQTGMVWFSANENPLVWARDFETMRDDGMRLLRYLHFSPFAAEGYEGKGKHSSLDLAKEPPLRLQRQTDALVQLLQKHGVAMFLALHDWLPVELSDEELAAQKTWNEFWTRRYRDVPGVLYDVQNEPSVGVPGAPHVVKLWNDWLVGRYGSREKVWAAWGQTGAPPADFDAKPVSGEWTDLKARDVNEFKIVLLNRWVGANRDGIKAGDPDALMTVGYLPPFAPADKVLGAACVDFSNTHYYGSLRDFLVQFKLIDRRFEGKSLSVGEFGAQAEHDARSHGQTGDQPDKSAEWFLAVTHGAFALGGSFVANWDWKEFQDCVFPWGIRNADLTPKPVARVYRCAERLLGTAAPVYRAPDVFLVLPDSHRLGAKWGDVHNALFHALDVLHRCQVDFGVVNERALQAGVPPAKALLWPVPYCPEDATFEKVRAWVEAGGVLYLSGDVQFDPDRRPTRAERRTALGLAPCEAKPPSDTPAERWTQPPAVVAVGKGRVFHVPAPPEMRARPENRDVYLRFLAEAGVARIGLEPESSDLVAGSIPLADGGRALALVNTADAPATVTWQTARLTLTIPPRRTGFAAVDGAGRLRALEGQGPALVDGKPVIDGDGHWMLLTDRPDQDLRQAASWLLMPLQPGVFRLPGFSPGAAKASAVFQEPCRGQPRELLRQELTKTNGVWTMTVPPDLVGVEVAIIATP